METIAQISNTTLYKVVRHMQTSEFSFFPSSSFDEMKITKLKKYFLKIIRMIRCFELKYKKNNTCRKIFWMQYLFSMFTVFILTFYNRHIFCVYQNRHSLLTLLKIFISLPVVKCYTFQKNRIGAYYYKRNHDK